MEGINDKIKQVKLLLEEIKSQLNPFFNSANKNDKQVQLEAVAKIVDKFDKINTELPPEIRALKFKLIQEIDQFKEAEELNQELQNTLTPFFNQKNTKLRKNKKTLTGNNGKKKHLGIKVIDLIDAKLIQPNTKIVKTVNGQEHEALITPNGKIKLVHNNNNTTIHNSLSLAAKEIMGRSINGWTWWQIEEQFEKKFLDYYRQKLIRNGK